MPNIYVGELQDYEGNTIYPHTEAQVVWMPEGESIADFLNTNVTKDDIKSIFNN